MFYDAFVAGPGNCVDQPIHFWTNYKLDFDEVATFASVLVNLPASVPKINASDIMQPLYAEFLQLDQDKQKCIDLFRHLKVQKLNK